MHRLDDNHAAIEDELHFCDAPMLGSHFGLSNFDAASAIESAEKSPAEGDVLEESSFDSRDAAFVAINGDYSLHSLQHLRLVIGRRKVWVWLAFQVQNALLD